MIITDITFGIVGGDLRYSILKDALEKDGYKVFAFCNKTVLNTADSIKSVFEACNAIIGPIPFSRNEKTVAFNDCFEMDINSFFADMYENNITLFFCGAFSEASRQISSDNGISVYDFFEYDEIAIKNAIPTAEGAIQAAMQESRRTLFASNSMVLGFGRCGKILSSTLKGMGAEVTVVCRKPRDAAFIYACGMRPLFFDELADNIAEADFVFNTVPAEVLNAKTLQNVRRKTVIIDIAKAPGGVDYNAAAQLGIKAVYCPGLPGRVAPETAALILKDFIVKTAVSHFSK